jgi:hypothetical protein
LNDFDPYDEAMEPLGPHNYEPPKFTRKVKMILPEDIDRGESALLRILDGALDGGKDELLRPAMEAAVRYGAAKLKAGIAGGTIAFDGGEFHDVAGHR